jgi:hypothetical protein
VSPQIDQRGHALLSDLAMRGLLASVTVSVRSGPSRRFLRLCIGTVQLS